MKPRAHHLFYLAIAVLIVALTIALKPQVQTEQAKMKSQSQPVEAAARNLSMVKEALPQTSAVAKPAQPAQVPMVSPIDQFATWLAKYELAPATLRPALLAEGQTLAQQRLEVMHGLIATDPEAALRAAIPQVVRRQLPASFTAVLEQPIAAKGDLVQLIARAPKGKRLERTTWREARLNDMTYEAFVYGRRAQRNTLYGASLSGIVVKDRMAVYDSPVVMSQRSDLPAGMMLEPVTRFGEHLAASGVSSAFEPEPDAPVVVADGRAFPVCCAKHATLLGSRWLAAEANTSSPYVLASDGGNVAAAPIPPVTSHVLGNKSLLVIVADFSDAPGRPTDHAEPMTEPSMTTTYLTDHVNNEVAPWFTEVSYGKTTISSVTVTNLLRLNGSLLTYADNQDAEALQTAAKNAATTAGFTLSSYDRVALVFANAGQEFGDTHDLPWAGLAEQGGNFSWYNGYFALDVVAHELTHNMGVPHANLWVAPSGSTDPLDPAGTSEEYGDYFDIMGTPESNPATNPDHPNPWFLRLIGWMPPEAVQTITSSGTYRMHRFDAQTANLANTLTLQIPRTQGIDYWLGFRKKYAGHASFGDMANGAYVTWGYPTNQQCNLIDVDTPTAGTYNSAFGDYTFDGGSSTPEDASLNVGNTLNDSAAGIRIRVAATGGSAPDEYLDVEVNFSPRIAFDLAKYAVDERSGSALLTVQRLNDGTGAISANFATVAGTATAGSDYTTTTGSLSWAANDFTSRTISVPITADGVAEGSGTESFIVRLSSVSGAALPSGADATVVIHDAGATDLSLSPPFLTSAASATVVDPDSKIVIGGYFTASSPLTVDGIARLFSDGSHDSSFDKAAGASPVPVTAIVRQPDGKYLVAGDFTSLRGVSRNRIARLNADGSLDTSFSVGTGPNNTINTIAVQPDGKVLVGGDFTTWNGSNTLRCLVRLEADGSVDSGFGSFTSVVSDIGGSLSVSAIALQPTLSAPHFGILVGGLFIRSPSGSNFHSGIVRLTSTGALDSSFDAVKGAHAAGASNSLRQVSSVAVQPDGKILVGGQFTGFNGTNANRLARLNSDGTNDSAFITAMGSGVSADVRCLWVQGDGKILIGGSFTSASGNARKGVARYTSTGAFDAEFKASIGAASGVECFTMQADGRLLLGLNGFDPDALHRTFTGQSSLPGVLSFTAPTFSGAEGSSATISVQRTGGSKGAVSVNYITRASGAATANSDYTTSSGTLTWADGDSAAKNISVPLLTDATTEGDESFSLALGVPIGGALLGAQSTTTTTIVGGDTSALPHVNFAAATSARTEGDTSAVTVTVNFTAAAGQAVSIPLVFSGSATLGSDYTSSTNTLSFSSTDTAQSFTLTALDDSILDDPLESAVITLGSPSGPALLGTDVTHTFSITDNEAAAHIDTPPASQTVALGGTATFSVVASGSPAPTYQWFKAGKPILGATSATYTISPALLTSIGTFKVEVTNHGTAHSSGNVELGVADATPKALVQTVGTAMKLTLSAAGNALSYQWYKGATSLSDSGGTKPHITGATSKVLTVNALQLPDATTAAETYHCVVSSGLGAADFTALPTTLEVIDTIPLITGPATLQAAIIGGSYNGNNEFITVDASVNRTPVTYSATGLPDGLSIDPATGQIIGIPAESLTAPKPFAVVLKATNGKGTSTFNSSITVSPLPAGSVGAFVGYIERNEALNLGLGGRFDLTTLTNGTGSGKVLLGAVTTSFKCQILTTIGTHLPTADFTIPRGTAKSPQNPLHVKFIIDADNNKLSFAKVSDGLAGGAPTASIIAWRNIIDKSNPTSGYPGYYTFGMKPPSTLANNKDIPQGISHGSFTVAGTGSLKVSGFLADGTAFTQSTFVGPLGEILLYVPLYTNTGSLVGALDLDTDALKTISGNVSWSRKSQTLTTQRSYKNGFVPDSPAPALPFFAIDLTPVGGLYTDPAKLVPVPIVMGLSDNDQNAKLTFGQAIPGLIPLDSPDIILTRLKVGGLLATPLAFSDANPRKVTLKVTSKTGAFSGTMTLTDQNPVAAVGTMITRTPNPAFKGFIVNDAGTPRGLGYFIVQELPSALVPATKTPFLSSPVKLESN